jgi:hypothetical protein
MCGPQVLPMGWSSYFDAEGRIYYVNSSTGESTWLLPQASVLPDGWSAHQDPEGRTYYANAFTGESSWTLPEVSLLPEGWTAHADAEGRTYYANASTGESSWSLPSTPSQTKAMPPLEPPPKVAKEFGLHRLNTAAAAADVVDVGSHASRLEERLMCGGFFQQINHFVGLHAHKFNDPTDGSGHSLETFTIFKEYEAMLSARCEHFLTSEGLTAEEVVNSMLVEEELGKKFKSSEYLMAAIDFEMFVSLMLDFKTGEKDVSRWWEICAEESHDWYNSVPAE